jgi:hypothetical protein
VALKERGWSIPQDAAIVAAGNSTQSKTSQSFDPPLTTVHMDLQGMGAAGIKLLIEAIKRGGRAPVRQVRLQPHLVVRNSSDPKSDYSRARNLQKRVDAAWERVVNQAELFARRYPLSPQLPERRNAMRQGPSPPTAPHSLSSRRARSVTCKPSVLSMLRFKSPFASFRVDAGLDVVSRRALAGAERCQSCRRGAARASRRRFMDFVAINGGPIKTRVYEDGPFAGAGKTFDPQVFFDLGIRYYRMGLKYDLTLPDQPQQVLEAYRKSGARAMMMIDHNKVKPEEVVGLIKQYDPRSIAEIEGPNELNNKFPPQNLNIKYKGKTDEAAGAVYMDEVYKSLKADPATRNFPVVAFTSIFSDYRAAKGHTGFDSRTCTPTRATECPAAAC